MPAMPMSTVFDALRPAGDVLTDEVISALRSIFGDRDVSYVTNTPVITLVHEIVTSLEISVFEGIQPVDAVNALLDFMRKLGVIAAPEQPVQTVKVELPKTLDQMTLTELLTLLRDEPNRYAELVPHIEELPAMRKASRRTTNWALRDTTGKLDVNATVDNVAHLNKLTSLVRKEVGGQRPTSLARICGQEERPMINPFATNSSEMVVIGPFYGDFDLGNLSEERHLAYLWARKHHSDWPKQIDLYEDVPAAFAEELKGRWKKMVDAYNAAKEDGDPTTEGLSRYASANVISGSRHPFGGEQEVKPERDETWYRQQLYDDAQASISVSSSSVRKSLCIIKSVTCSSGSASLDNVIVLEGVRVNSGSLSGKIFMPHGQEARVRSGSNRADIYNRSYKDLYDRAVKQGIISSGGNTEAPSPEPEVTFQNNFYGGASGRVVQVDGNLTIQNFGDLFGN